MRPVEISTDDGAQHNRDARSTTYHFLSIAKRGKYLGFL